MRLRKAVLAALGSVSLTGCGFSTGGCPDKAFEIETSMTTSTLEDIAQMHGKSVDDLSCDEICIGVSQLLPVLSDSLNFITEVDNCQFVIGAATQDGADASVFCDGLAIPFCGVGRRPMGHVAFAAHVGDLGRYYAGCAHMEAASIRAFLELSRQLRSWDAPPSLAERCRVAAEDEFRHARIFYRLAVEEGCLPPTPRQESAPNDLFAVAMHNAVEGCVNESWGALVAHYQARHATSERLRMMYAQIADDETEHGQLAWDLHAWFMTQLPPEQCERVQHAQAQAIEALADCAPEPEWAPACVGLPAYDHMQALAMGFSQELAQA